MDSRSDFCLLCKFLFFKDLARRARLPDRSPSYPSSSSRPTSLSERSLSPAERDSSLDAESPLDLGLTQESPPQAAYRGYRVSRADNHYETFADLAASAETCSLCRLFKLALVQTVPEAFKHSSEDALTILQRGDTTHGRFKIAMAPSSRDGPITMAHYFREPLGETDDWLRIPLDRPHVGVLFCRRLVDDTANNAAFPLMSSARETASENEIIQGRKISPSVDFDLCRRWLGDCDGHEKCNIIGRLLSFRPSRLIDVGSKGSGVDIICLCSSNMDFESDSEEPLIYACLSWRWGTTKPWVLTAQSTTLPSFPDLPKTFQDAVTVTRELGIRYLWIDALCILQDDKEDWERECACMADIYRNAYVTIAARDTIDSTTGFLERTPSTKSQVQIDNISIALQEDDSTYMDPDSDNPLASRGWVYQERLLSRRILYFGKYKLSWECGTLERYEDLHVPIVPPEKGSSKSDFRRPKEPGELHDYWRYIIMLYSTRMLSHRNDRLPALSGIASEFQEKMDDTYFAGIWRSQFLQNLLWLVRPSEPSAPTPTVQQAPSWSWAAVNEPVEYRMNGRPFFPDAGVLSIECSPVGHDPFGQVREGAQVTLSARSKKVYVMRENTYGGHDTDHDPYEGDRFYLWDVSLGELMSRLFPDDYHLDLESGQGTSPRWSTELDIMSHDAECAEDECYHEHSQDIKIPGREVLILFIGWLDERRYACVQALAVEPVPGRENTYRRIGYTKSDISGSNGEWVRGFDEKRTFILI